MYALKTSRGYLTIRPAEASSCELWLNETRIRECDSANAAAQLVVSRRTGSAEIDNEQGAYPRDIDGWHWIPVSLSRRRPATVSRLM